VNTPTFRWRLAFSAAMFSKIFLKIRGIFTNLRNLPLFLFQNFSLFIANSKISLFLKKNLPLNVSICYSDVQYFKKSLHTPIVSVFRLQDWPTLITDLCYIDFRIYVSTSYIQNCGKSNWFKFHLGTIVYMIKSPKE
jgi:hypothetical protein